MKRIPPPFTALLSAVLVLAGCSDGEIRRDSTPAPTGEAPAAASPTGPALPEPDLSTRNPLVRQQITERRAWHREVLASGKATPKQQAEAFAELGNLYQAYDFPLAAEACYERAATLDPQDFRWPYYLAQLYRKENRDQESLASFERALELAPENVPTLVRMAEVLIDQDRPDEAEPLLRRALALEEETAAAHFSLGMIEAGRRDPAAAVRHFEAALALQPLAAAVHNPLGLAYRDLGRMDDARRHLAEAGEDRVELRDPLMFKLYGLSDGVMQFVDQGLAQLQAGDLAAAARTLRQAVVADPLYSRPRFLLGRVLVLLGDLDAAETQLRIALGLAPDDPPVRFGMADLLQRTNRGAEAVPHYRAGLASEPENAAARFYLARALHDLGRLEQAVTEYAEAVRVGPGNRLAWLGQATALQQLGRCAEARLEVERGLGHLGKDGLLAQALARLLAACPDAASRDGARALDLARSLFEAAPSPQHGEAVAMAMAELQRFDEALDWQTKAVAQARSAGRVDLVDILQKNLSLFAEGQPSRTPWRPEDIVLFTGS